MHYSIKFTWHINSMKWLYKCGWTGRRRRWRWRWEEERSWEQGAVSGSCWVHPSCGRKQWCWSLVTCHGQPPWFFSTALNHLESWKLNHLFDTKMAASLSNWRKSDSFTVDHVVFCIFLSYRFDHDLFCVVSDIYISQTQRFHSQPFYWHWFLHILVVQWWTVGWRPDPLRPLVISDLIFDGNLFLSYNIKMDIWCL